MCLLVKTFKHVFVISQGRDTLFPKRFLCLGAIALKHQFGPQLYHSTQMNSLNNFYFCIHFLQWQ